MSSLDRFKRHRPRAGRAETDAEQMLWVNLFRIPVEGTHFRRQVEIGSYRAGIGLLGLRLLIEVDGPIHDEPFQQQHDSARDAWLMREGYRVLRFPNQRVMTDMNSVLHAIKLAIDDQKRLLRPEA